MRKRWLIEAQPINGGTWGNPWGQWDKPAISLDQAKRRVESHQEWPLSPPHEWRIRHVKTKEIYYFVDQPLTGSDRWIRVQRPRKK